MWCNEPTQKMMVEIMYKILVLKLATAVTDFLQLRLGRERSKRTMQTINVMVMMMTMRHKISMKAVAMRLAHIRVSELLPMIRG
mmetsp:Transcript_65347/g.104054  ORF Transcript_65347/g.104054 Transcript_65347/m.104054 type:complete len:84 (-) Transcript_65347:208-459(-)